MNPDKILCPCYNITKGDVVKAIEQGASSYKEIKQITKLGKSCGKCKKKAKKFIEELLNE